MTEPTSYDLIQDDRLDAIDELISPDSYQPPGEQEYSFPIIGQGVTQDQFRLMNAAQGKGIIHRGGTPYGLTWPEGDETQANQTNTMVLTVSGHGTAESVINGFFHRMTENMIIHLPAVTTTTVYHICVTYDPRLSETTPLKVETYAGPPPTTHGRDHIVLWKVTRNPNELLSQAVREVVRPIISPTFYVNGFNHLPDPESVPNGTIANVAGSGLYSAIASVGWRDMLGHLAPKAGPWTDCSLLWNWEHYSTFGTVQARLNQGKVEMRGAMRNGQWAEGRTVLQLPPNHHPSGQRPLTAHYAGRFFDIRALTHGGVQFFGSHAAMGWVSFEGVSFAL